MHKENETHQILWDSETQTDLLTPTRGTDLVLINKQKTCSLVDFTISADHQEKIKEYEKKDKYLGFAKEIKKKLEHEGDGDTNCSWCSWKSL